MPYKSKEAKAQNGREYRSRPEVAARRKAARPAEHAARKAMRFSETPAEREARLSVERKYDRDRAARTTDEQRAAKRAYFKEWRRRNQQKQRDYERARRVGIHPDEIERLRRVQGGACAICGSAMRQPGAAWTRQTEHLDHCHETGRVRGLLCGSCNGAIGKLGDNYEGVMRAAHYLGDPADPDCF